AATNGTKKPFGNRAARHDQTCIRPGWHVDHLLPDRVSGRLQRGPQTACQDRELRHLTGIEATIALSLRSGSLRSGDLAASQGREQAREPKRRARPFSLTGAQKDAAGT